MELRGVEVKKVSWTAEKLDADGEVKTPAKVSITLEIDDPASAEVKELLDFAQRRCVWKIEQLQAEFSMTGA